MRKIRITLLFLFVANIIGATLVFATQSVPRQDFAAVEVVVRSGDTVWEIGGRFASRSEDVREVVARIYKENKLDGKNVIKPGQRLRVPVHKESGS